MPAVIARQARHRGQQPFGTQMVHECKVGVGHLDGVAVHDVGDVDDVEQTVLVEAGDTAYARSSGVPPRENLPASW